MEHMLALARKRLMSTLRTPLALDEFAFRQFDDPQYTGSKIPMDKQEFLDRANDWVREQGAPQLVDGYAPFCKHLFVPNFSGARLGDLDITPENRHLLKSGYQARNERELPVLCRWFDSADVDIPQAAFLDLILYSRDQILEENQAQQVSDQKRLAPDDSWEWGIISIKCQSVDYETPMQPITMLRNALGKEEGGSGVPLEREKYLESVAYWDKHATILAAGPKLRILRSDTFDPVFNLATEEWIFRSMTPDCHLLFLWRNHNTVVIGRNQNPWKECHVQRMEEDKVTLARRRSGGGAVFQDLGNTCFTFMSPIESYDKNVNSEILIRALRHHNIEAAAQGRNDLVTDGRKFSGSAFKLTRDRAFHHGTLMRQVDMGGMVRYLNPNKAKLQSKGVASVQARVVNLCDLQEDLTHEALSESIMREFQRFHGGSVHAVEDLSHADLSADPALKGYYEELNDWKWRFGETPVFTHNLETRFDWGIMDIFVNSRKGLVESATVYSDSLFPEFVEQTQFALQGTTYDAPGIRRSMQLLRQQNQDDPEMVSRVDEMEAWLIRAL